ncbi:lipoprotein 17-related variable surface protein [Mycoplasma seminis]|uniref:1-phosphatidylinositol phosphodiesterase n=1 Tax=Mycoplasma seminis TaxID=512749 RepID=A0ABY9HA03_9MOLU|nr:lipoprotein 17-related variable surface protein [Mycoplasma seminis]WLP85168.1 lipoprotein 17-related variable surface protein [Mycoplasma seminis]
MKRSSIKKKIFLTTFGSILPITSCLTLLSANGNENDWKKWDLDDNLSYYNFDKTLNGTKVNLDEYAIFSKWMQGVNDKKTLFELSLPGTHDSGMWDGSGWAWTFGWPIARTQSLNFNQQLATGIRAFDIRLDSDLNLRHGVTYSKTNFQQTMQTMVEFVKQNPSEFVIMRVKDENFDVHNQALAKKASDNYMKVITDPSINSYLFNPKGEDPFNLDFSLKNLRGKIIIINFWHYLVNLSHIGGFLYDEFIDRRTTQQDVYDNVTPAQKVQLWDAMAVKSSQEPFDEELFVNFTSIAGSARMHPDNYAQIMNPNVMQFLASEEEKITRLGLVYMDFPFVGLNEGIIKRNYYMTDDQLKKGYEFPWNEAMTPPQHIWENSNEFNLSADNFKGYHIDVLIDDVVVKSFDFTNGTKEETLNFGNDFFFKLGSKVKINAYKLTWKNPYYPQRKYNEFNFEITVEKSTYTTEWEIFKKRVEALKNSFQALDSFFTAYLDEKYLNKLNTIIRPLQSNELILDGLINQFKDESSDYNDLLSKLKELKSFSELVDTNEFNNEQLKDSLKNAYKIFNQFEAEKVNNNEFNLKQAIETITSFQTTLEQIIDLNSRIKDINSISEQIAQQNPDYLNLGLQDKINSWNIQDFASAANSVFENLPNNFEVLNQIQSEIETIENSQAQVEQNIAELNKIKSENNLNWDTFKIFSDDITETFQSYNYDKLKQDIKLYFELLELKKQVQQYLDNINVTKQDLMFNRQPLQSQETFNALVETLQNTLNNSQKPLDYDGLQKAFDDVKNEQITLEHNKESYLNKVKSLDNYLISNKQKEILKDKITQTNDITSPEIDNYLDIAKEIEKLNLNDWVKTVSKKELNPTILQLANTTLDSIDIEQIKKIQNQVQDLFSPFAELKALVAKYNSYQDKDYYPYLSPEIQEQFNAQYTNAKNVLNNSKDIQQFKQANEQLNQWDSIINSILKQEENKLVQELNSSDIFNYEKTLIKKDIDELTFKNISNIKQAINLAKEHYANVVNSFNQLKQKSAVIDFLNQSNDLDEFNARRKRADDLKDIILDILKRKEDLNNTYDIYYPTANKVDQDNYNTAKKVLDNLLQTSINAPEISRAFNNYIQAGNKLDNRGELVAQIVNINSEIDKKLNDDELKNNVFYAEVVKKYLASRIKLDVQQLSQYSYTKLESLLNEISKYLLNLDTSIQESIKQWNNYRAFYNSFIFNVKNKDILPNLVTEKDLISNQSQEGFEIKDIVLKPNNTDGNLSIEYQISYNGYSEYKGQIISGFLTTAQVQMRLNLEELLKQIKALEIPKINNEYVTKLQNQQQEQIEKLQNADNLDFNQQEALYKQASDFKDFLIKQIQYLIQLIVQYNELDRVYIEKRAEINNVLNP